MNKQDSATATTIAPIESTSSPSIESSSLPAVETETSPEQPTLSPGLVEEDKVKEEAHSDDDDLEEGELKDDDDGSTELTLNQSDQHKQDHHLPNKQTSYHSTSPSSSALLPTPRLPPRNSQPIQKSSICRYFSSNACTWGDSCRFLHIITPSDTGCEYVDSIRSFGNSRGPPPLPPNQLPFHEKDHHMRHYPYSTPSSSNYHDLHQSPQSPLPPHATPGYSSYRRHHNTTPPPISSAAISPSTNLRGLNRPPPQSASSSLSSASRPYPSSSAEYERRRRLAFELEPGKDRRDIYSSFGRDSPRAPRVNGPHYRDIHLGESYNHRDPMPRREHQGYSGPNQSSYNRSPVPWNRASAGPDYRSIPSDDRRPNSLKRHHPNEDVDESSWSDDGSSDDSLIGGASSDNSASRSNKSATNMGTGTPIAPDIPDERRVQLLQQLEEVEEAIARKRAKNEVEEQEQSQ